MTRIERSDAQLDAEAEARKMAEGAEWTPDEYGSDSEYRATPSRARHVVQPLLRKPRTRLESWRAAIAAETPDRLATGRPPTTIDKIDGVRFPVIDPGTRVGYTMAGPFLRYLDGSGGQLFPGHDALRAWDRKCRRDHARWADHRGRPVCAEIAWYVLRDRTTLLFAAETTNVSYPRAENLLRLAIDWMARQQRRWVREATVPHDREACRVCREADEAVAG